MPLESTQMLATIVQVHGGVAKYKPTHQNHPCTLWAQETVDNYQWLLTHGKALCAEYSHRYGRVHACQALLEGELSLMPKSIRRTGLTDFAQAMPDTYRGDDAVIAYRRYYLAEKSGFAKWTNRLAPVWFECNMPDMDI